MKYFLVLFAVFTTFTVVGAPIAIKSVDDVVTNLNSDNSTGQKRAIDWLNNKKNPVVKMKKHPNPLLQPLLASEKKNLRNAATKAYLRWARPEDSDILIELCSQELARQPVTRLPAFQALFRTSPAKGREYFEEQVENGTNHFQMRAVQAIRELGSDFEGEVTPLLKSPNRKVVDSAVHILSVVGTSKSIPPLQNISQPNKTEEFRINQAIKKIEAREGV